MSDVIKLLPDSVANQIAAGEVIQRPASVIKELVENAMDAGATKVDIYLKDAGRTLIQVVDNGQGMSPTDARLAFERHSTSKITSAEDLFSLRTMGFRGEALASIAAISQVELRTKRKGDELGTQLMISASVCDSQEPCACSEGSNFKIKNIFFNVPARRKFLKSNQVELSNIIKEFEKLALVNHDVEFTLTHNERLMYKLLPGTFKQRIVALLGNAIDGQLLPLTVDTSLVQVSGFVCRPENARKRNALQYMFVNGRYMRHPYFHKAVQMSYSGLIPEDEQPNYFLMFTVAPETIDVNIHPTKTEIKFENEMPIWQILSAAVKESLGRFSSAPSIEFDVEGAPEIPVYDKSKPGEMPPQGVDPSYNPFRESRRKGFANPTTNWEELYKNFEQKAGRQNDVRPVGAGAEIREESVWAESEGDNATTGLTYMQIKERYILLPVQSGVMVVDQHRAHLLVIYTRLISEIENKAVSSQSVLFPEVISLSPSQSVILAELEPELEPLGFGLSRLSANEWSVTAMPMSMEGAEVKDVIRSVIDAVENGGEAPGSVLSRRVALSVARNAAIKYGRALDVEEMERLVADLLQLPNPNYTPDGKRVLYIMPIETITKNFQ